MEEKALVEVKKRGRKALCLLDIISAEEIAGVKKLIKYARRGIIKFNYLQMLYDKVYWIIKTKFPSIKAIKRYTDNILQREFAYLDYDPRKPHEFLKKYYTPVPCCIDGRETLSFVIGSKE